MSNIEVTVCVCTHAPNVELLARVINALSLQTLDPGRWEVLLVENSERQTLDASILSPLPCHSRLMLESKSGKVQAMAAAALEASGAWVVFVDDDNLVAPDYLEALLKLHGEFPQIGVFSASITGSFESPVPEWAQQFLPYLAVRSVETPVWANCHPSPVGPIGAGMCARMDIFREFSTLVRKGDLCPGLGRTRGTLTAGTDDTIFMDIAFRSGYGCGSFPDLKLQHVIHPSRLEWKYLKRLVRDITYSHALLEGKRHPRKISILRSALKLIYDQLVLLRTRPWQVRGIKRSRAMGLWTARLQMWRQDKASGNTNS